MEVYISLSLSPNPNPISLSRSPHNINFCHAHITDTVQLLISLLNSWFLSLSLPLSVCVCVCVPNKSIELVAYYEDLAGPMMGMNFAPTSILGMRWGLSVWGSRRGWRILSQPLVAIPNPLVINRQKLIEPIARSQEG